MASNWYNQGKAVTLAQAFRNDAIVTATFYFALLTSSYTFNVDNDTWTTILANEIATGNNYNANGQTVAFGSGGWAAAVADDTNDRGYIVAQDIAWAASGGSIPDSGDGARWGVLMDDNATPANRILLADADLVSDRTVSDGQTLTLQNYELRID